jgi:hypothetical protein
MMMLGRRVKSTGLRAEGASSFKAWGNVPGRCKTINSQR